MTPERRGARERLLEWADQQDTWLTEKLTKHGEQGTYAAVAGNILHHLDAIESEAVDRRLAELREALPGVLAEIGHFGPSYFPPNYDVTIFGDTPEVIAAKVWDALLTSDARDRSPE